MSLPLYLKHDSMLQQRWRIHMYLTICGGVNILRSGQMKLILKIRNSETSFDRPLVKSNNII